MRKIKDYILFNLQSWDDSSEAVPLDPNIVNIIEGPNETGKSVLFKMFYEMCFPGYWDSRSLLRRNCEAGVFAVTFEDGTGICYELHATHHRHHLMRETEIVKTWVDEPMPQELIELGGFILDYENKIILNIIDKDTPLPFIKTSPRLNASLIKSVVEPQDIQAFFNKCTELTANLKQAYSGFKRNYDTYDAKQAVLERMDVEGLRLQLAKMKECETAAAPAFEMKERIDAVCKTMLQRPKSVPDIKAKTGGQIEVFYNLLKCKSAVDSLSEMYKTKPDYQEVNLKQINIYCLIYKKTLGAINILRAVNALAKPAEVIFSPEVLDITNAFRQTLKSYIQLRKSIESAKSLEVQGRAVIIQIKEIESKIGTCPTCGRLLCREKK